MKTLKIKDNCPYSQDYFSEIPVLTKTIRDKTLWQLECEGIFVFPELVKDADDLTKDQMILQSFNNNYRSSNVMGFLGLGEERLLIGSRFSRDDNDYFLQYMLERVLNLNILTLDTDADPDDTLIHLLFFLFPYYLKTAMRKGLFKSYICKQYNDTNVKGIIDIPRHIRCNTPFVGKVAYNQREYSYDNILTELIRHTIEYIKNENASLWPFIMAQAKDEIRSVTNATQSYRLCDRRKIITDNNRNPLRHAYYHEYRVLQRLCLMILRDEKHRIGSGSQKIYGILFDGAWLWEEYINTLVADLFYHPMNKSNKGCQYLFSIKTKKTGKIYPDFISVDSRERIIADAKYKPFDNVRGDDYLQLLAYMFRFDAKAGYYFYPDRGESCEIKYRLNSGTTYEKNDTPRDDIFVKKLGLVIPEAKENYEQFKADMEQNEKAFKKGISFTDIYDTASVLSSRTLRTTFAE